MPAKKKKEFKAFPMVLPRPSKSKKLAAEFAKKNPKKKPVNLKQLEEQKNEIAPLVTRLEDGTYLATQSNQQFDDLFQLIANLK